MKTNKELIIKDSFIYSFSSYISIFIGFFVGILTKRFLGVSGSGYWALYMVILTYGMYVGLGIKDALVREIPQAQGASDYNRISRLQNAGFSYLFAASLFCIFVLWAISYFISNDPVLKFGMLIMGVLVLATHLYNLMLTILRSRKKFGLVGRLIILNTLLSATFPLLGAYYFNVKGYAIGMVCATFLSFYFSQRFSNTQLRFKPDIRLTKDLLKVGTAMFISGFLFKTFLSIDKIMIGRMLGIEELGLYSIGLMAVGQVTALPHFAQIVIFPRIQERYGATKEVADLKDMVLRPTYIISRLAPVIIIALIIVIELLVYYLLPQFKGGLDAMKVLMFGYFFMVVNEMPSSLIFTINKQNFFIPFYAGLILINIALNYLFVKLGLGIVGIAMATSISNFLLFVIIFGYSMKHIISYSKLVKFFSGVLIVYAYFLFNFLWIDRLKIFSHLPPAAALIKFSSLALISIPVLIEVERREAIFSTVLQLIKTKAILSSAKEA